MDNMIVFSEAYLKAIADFLIQPPVFYVFGLICLLFVCKAIKILIN